MFLLNFINVKILEIAKDAIKNKLKQSMHKFKS